MCDDVTFDDYSIKAVIMTFLGPLTRHHIVALRASSRSCAEFKKAAMDVAGVNVMDGMECTLAEWRIRWTAEQEEDYGMADQTAMKSTANKI